MGNGRVNWVINGSYHTRTDATGDSYRRRTDIVILNKIRYGRGITAPKPLELEAALTLLYKQEIVAACRCVIAGQGDPGKT